MFDMGNPYRKVMIRGRVTEMTWDGAEDHTDKLTMKYHGKKCEHHGRITPGS